ncbi:MAG: hydrogenase formation protein HypD [Candidatus Poribacteria bacterium]
MKYLDEYRQPNIVKKILDKIRATSKREIKLMEVCGTHTVAIFRSGIKDILPENISLISGPGCPVCVTSREDIDKAIAISRQKDVILATYGDMFRVPGSRSSFENEKANGADVRIVYSSLDALEIARKNPQKMLVLMGIGFETTSPTIASAIITAKKENLKNFYVLVFHKVIPPAMKAILDSDEVMINGFICPGHVSTIIGSHPYEFIAKDYNVGCVIAGFEPVDILQGILMLVQMIESETPKIEIEYRRVVKPEGNPIALGLMNEVFKICDSKWRGLGVIPKSGLELRDEYAMFDANSVFDVKIDSDDESEEENSQCMCGEILKGSKIPIDCRLFGDLCTPDTPIGPCMVSSEGTCAAYFKYGNTKNR